MEKNKKNLIFPDNFLWGVSTSAYQIEGGIENDWSEWEASKLRITNYELRTGKKFDFDNFVCGQACDSYNRYKEDIRLAKELGCKAFRLGIEWARIEPNKGVYNYKEIEHYRNVLKEIKDSGLETVVTLWHWTNPIWLTYCRYGWAQKEIVDHFSRYVELIVRELGDLVDFWITLNEPMVHVVNGHITGKFPPGKKNIFSALKVFLNLVSAHKKSFDIIHEKYPEARVSITALVNYFEPARKRCLIERLFSWLAHYIWNDCFLQRIKKHIDFIAFDYYFHYRIIWRPPFKKNLNKEITDMGWEIYPEGIYHVIRYLRKFKKPIYVMENGLADADDSRRSDFIINHLRYVHKAITEGADVRGYFHWSLLDNFEWAAGWEPKFGLYAVDRKIFARKPRPSAKVYAEICKNNKIKI